MNTCTKRKEGSSLFFLCHSFYLKSHLKTEMTLDRVFHPRSRVISVHSLYLTSFLILSFLNLPFAFSHNTQNTFFIILKGECLCFRLFSLQRAKFPLTSLSKGQDFLIYIIRITAVFCLEFLTFFTSYFPLAEV